jgi:hypothetical protein
MGERRKKKISDPEKSVPFCNHPSFLIIMQCARHILHFFFLFFFSLFRTGNQSGKQIDCLADDPFPDADGARPFPALRAP